MTLAELAQRLRCVLAGDGTIEVFRAAGLEDAGPGEISFLSNPKYASHLATTRASAVIVAESVSEAPCALLHTAKPYLAFANAVAILTPPRRPAPGISPHAVIDATAAIGPGVSIGPFVWIGPRARIGAHAVVYSHVSVGDGASIGEACVIHSHVSIRDGVEIGNRVTLQDAAVIGSDGFGFAPRGDGTHQKIPQVGRVVIEDDVEIGAHCAVDRPAVGETRIAAGTKIDNLVQIAHGVKVGRNVLLAAQVGIAGSTVLEDDVIMAGQSGATGHVRIGRAATVGAKSAVTKDIDAGHDVAGIPAVDKKVWRESAVLMRRLPEFRKALGELAAKVAAIDARLRPPSGD